MQRRQKFAARTAAAPTAGSVVVLLGLAMAAGCFEPRYENGRLRCSGDVCPRGHFCAADNTCWKNGDQPTPGVDAGDDTPPADGSEGPPVPAPVLVQPASASPSPVQGNSTLLTVLADDPQGEGGGLTYHWNYSGPPGVAFSAVNGRDTTAVFMKAGQYEFTVTIRNSRGGSISSMVVVEVQSRLNDIAINPSMRTLKFGETQTFTAMGFDQFGDDLALPMPPRWDLAGACGTVNQATGVVTAGMMVAANCPLFATVGTVTSSASVSVGTTPPTEIVPIADSFVRDGEADTNFGGDTLLNVKNQTDSNNNRIAYLKFSLAGLSLPATTVKLRLFGRAFGGTHMHGVFAVADTTWQENTITWRNRPPVGIRRATVGVTTAPKYHEWDLTTHVRERLMAGDMLMSLAVQMEVPVTSEPDRFDSKEATNRPQLVLTP